jgi:hypothetical protein
MAKRAKESVVYERVKDPGREATRRNDSVFGLCGEPIYFFTIIKGGEGDKWIRGQSGEEEHRVGCRFYARDRDKKKNFYWMGEKYNGNSTIKRVQRYHHGERKWEELDKTQNGGKCPDAR